MKKNIILTGVFAAMLWSCEKENLPEVLPLESSGLENKITVRSRENVESIVLDLFRSQPLLKEASANPMKRAKMEIAALTSAILTDKRSVKHDTLLFVVKNAAISSSVIVSANAECEPIIAILDSENISLDDLVLDMTDDEDPLVPILLSAIEYNKDPKSFDAYREALVQDERIEDIVPTLPRTRSGSSKTIVEEVLPRVKVQWGQSQDPYTRYTPNHWHAGCVATAVAQALSVTRHVNSVNGVHLDWNNLVKMKNSTYRNMYPNEANTIGRLMREIGYMVGMSYAASGSGANVEKAVKMFFTGKWNPYFVNPSKNAIKLGLKEHSTNVSIIGSRTKKPNWFGKQRGAGHAYVVDGYRIYSDGSDLLHVNFGWDHPKYIGYFMTRLWDPYFLDDAPAKYPYSMEVYNIRKR